MSGISKVTAERHQRMLLELVQQPGNDVCADCKARLPRWASWNIGIFLCVQCASVHRKIGTHITKVKSLTLDSWTREQVDSMKNTGNIKSNAYYNPDERRNPPPTNMEDSERDSELEKYIRAKYEYKKFVAAPGTAAAQAEKKANGLLPPPPPKEPKERGERQPRSRTAPLPQHLVNKPSPPPVPANESPARVAPFAQQPQPMPTQPAFRPNPSPGPPMPGRPPQFPGQMPQFPPQQPQIQLPPPMPIRPPVQPATPSALPPTSPLYGEMMALQTGSPLPTPPIMQQQSTSMPPMGAPNPFQGLQAGGPSFPSAFGGLARSPSRSVSLPLGAQGMGSPALTMQPTGLNPFFAQQQQAQQPPAQQSAFLSANPTGYTSPFPSPFPSAGAGAGAATARISPINIPIQSQATGYFNPSPQSATATTAGASSFLSPSPSGQFLQQPGTSPFSAAYGGGVQSTPSPFQQLPALSSTSPFQQNPFPQSTPSPFQQLPQPSPFSSGTPTYAQTPVSPFSQMSASPFGQLGVQQPQQQPQEQGTLGAFASGMMPRSSTNPFQR